MNSHAVEAPDMGYIFPHPPRNVFYQLSPAELIEQALKKDEGKLTETGALATDTGEFTGSTTVRRFIAEDDITRDRVWWNKVNCRLAEGQFGRLKQQLTTYLRGSDVFVRDACACANEKYHIDIRVITEMAYQNLFVHQALLRPGALRPEIAPEWTIIAAPGFSGREANAGIPDEHFTAISFDQKMILIGGTGYAGEIRKSIFFVLNFILPAEKGVLPMHCAANTGANGDTALFFGLPGTGKTILATDPDRNLIGDDEHGWSDYTIFGIEGGCHITCAPLNEEDGGLPENASGFGTLAEYTAFRPGSRLLSDAGNISTTFALDRVKNAVIPPMGVCPRHIFFLADDAFGVLPPVAKLTAEQALYYYISGYSGKINRRQAIGDSPEVVFSACFGAEFLAFGPERYAALFEKKIREHSPGIWLLNTGQLGGPGSSRLIKPRYTRAIITAILNNELADAHFIAAPVFHTAMPLACPGVPDKFLDPAHSWSSPEAYEDALNRLAILFHSNFEQYTGVVSVHISEAGPAMTVSA